MPKTYYKETLWIKVFNEAYEILKEDPRFNQKCNAVDVRKFYSYYFRYCRTCMNTFLFPIIHIPGLMKIEPSVAKLKKLLRKIFKGQKRIGNKTEEEYNKHFYRIYEAYVRGKFGTYNEKYLSKRFKSNERIRFKETQFIGRGKIASTSKFFRRISKTFRERGIDLEYADSKIKHSRHRDLLLQRPKHGEDNESSGFFAKQVRRSVQDNPLRLRPSRRT